MSALLILLAIAGLAGYVISMVVRDDRGSIPPPRSHGVDSQSVPPSARLAQR